MTARTLTLIRSVLETDPDLRPEQVCASLVALRSALEVEGEASADPSPMYLSEREAARLLGVSGMFLCRWRLGQRRGPVPPFPFRVLTTPAGTYRYLAAEVRDYRDRALSSSAIAHCPLPITHHPSGG